MKLKSLFIFSIFAMMSMSSCQFLPSLPGPNVPEPDITTGGNSETSETSNTTTGSNMENDPTTYEYHKKHYGYVGTEEEFNIDKQRNTLGYKKEFNVTVTRLVVLGIDNYPGFWQDIQNRENYVVINDKKTFANGENIAISETYDTNYATLSGVYEDLQQSVIGNLYGKYEFSDYRAYKDTNITLVYTAKYFMRNEGQNVFKPNKATPLRIPMYPTDGLSPSDHRDMTYDEWQGLRWDITKKSNPNQTITIDKINKTIMADEEGEFTIKFKYGDFTSDYETKYSITNHYVYTIDWLDSETIRLENVLPKQLDFNVQYIDPIDGKLKIGNFKQLVTANKLKIVEKLEGNKLSVLDIDGVTIRSKHTMRGNATINIIDPNNNNKAWYEANVEISEGGNIYFQIKLGQDYQDDYFVNEDYSYSVFANYVDYTKYVTRVVVKDAYDSDQYVSLNTSNHTVRFLKEGFYRFSVDIFNQTFTTSFNILKEKTYKRTYDIEELYDSNKKEAPGKYLYDTEFDILNIFNDAGEALVEVGNYQYHIDSLTADKSHLKYENGKYVFTKGNDFYTNEYTKGIKRNAEIRAILMFENDAHGNSIVYGIITHINRILIPNAIVDKDNIISNREYDVTNNIENIFAFKFEGTIISVTNASVGTYLIYDMYGTQIFAILGKSQNGISRDTTGTLTFDYQRDIPNSSLQEGMNISAILINMESSANMNYVGGYLPDCREISTYTKEVIKTGEVYHLPIINNDNAFNIQANVENSNIIAFDEDNLTITGLTAGESRFTYHNQSGSFTITFTVTDDQSYRGVKFQNTFVKHVLDNPNFYKTARENIYGMNARIVKFIDDNGEQIDKINTKASMVVSDIFDNQSMITIKENSLEAINYDNMLHCYKFTPNEGDENLITAINNLKIGDIIYFTFIYNEDDTLSVHISDINGERQFYHTNYDPSHACYDILTSVTSDDPLQRDIEFVPVDFDGFNLSITDSPGNSTSSRYWREGDGKFTLRVYRNATLNINSTSDKLITKILLNVRDTRANVTCDGNVVVNRKFYRYEITPSTPCQSFDISTTIGLHISGIEIIYGY